MVPETYRRVLATEGVRLPLTGATIGRLPFAAGALATLLLVQGSTGSFADAGLVNAAYSIAVAIGLPLQGRIIDRVGQTWVFVAVTAISSAAMSLLVVLAQSGSSVAAMAAASAVAGATVPPIGTSIRTLISDLVRDPLLRQSAFALDAVMVEVAFIVGPVVTAVVVGLASPAAAVLVNVVLAVLGSTLFAASRASRAWRGVPHDLGLVGPLRSTGVLVIMGTGLGVGIAVGAIELGMTAFAADHDARELAGVLISAQAAGSLLAGLTYGSRTWRGSPARRLSLFTAGMVLTMVPLLLVPSLAIAFPLMLLSGVALAPTVSVIYTLLDSIAPPGTATEATGWVLTAVVGGASIGTGVAGAAVNASGPHTGFAVALGGALVALTAALIGRRSLYASSELLPEAQPSQ
jgi:MFS family permease